MLIPAPPPSFPFLQLLRGEEPQREDSSRPSERRRGTHGRPLHRERVYDRREASPGEAEPWLRSCGAEALHERLL